MDCELAFSICFGFLLALVIDDHDVNRRDGFYEPVLFFFIFTFFLLHISPS